MSNFDLSNYKTVPERIVEAKAAYPEGRFQSRIIDLPSAFAGSFIAVEAKFYRTADDPTPAVGLAWEPTPGKTPYTKDSELQNAETSAWGRALIAAFAADASRGIASAEEVRGRQPAPKGQLVDDMTPPYDPAAHARDSVQQFRAWTDEERKDSFKRHSNAVLGHKPATPEEVTKVVEAMAEEYYNLHPDEAPF